MINFENAKFVKLRPVNEEKHIRTLMPMLMEGEQVIESFQAIRDYVVFTNKRIIAVNVQGLTGKKQDFTSLPYKTIQAFSVETAGVLDLDAELELWFAGLGKVRYEFTARTKISTICKMISENFL